MSLSYGHESQLAQLGGRRWISQPRQSQSGVVEEYRVWVVRLGAGYKVQAQSYSGRLDSLAWRLLTSVRVFFFGLVQEHAEHYVVNNLPVI